MHLHLCPLVNTLACHAKTPPKKGPIETRPYGIGRPAADLQPTQVHNFPKVLIVSTRIPKTTKKLANPE